MTGFVSGGTTSIKTIGVGAVVAIVFDALLVRALLVPATMRLMGRWNWWAPWPLAQVYRRYGLRETDPRSLSTVVPTTTVEPKAGAGTSVRTDQQGVELNSDGSAAIV